MASVVGCSYTSGSWTQFKSSSLIQNSRSNKKKLRVSCISSSLMSDPYRTLRISPDASESEVKKAFRRLALQYHPDVCRESNSGVQFQQINEAYDIIMSRLRGELEVDMYGNYYETGAYEEMGSANDQDWDLWEEWMGWEGAGIRDYSSHINPYI